MSAGTIPAGPCLAWPATYCTVFPLGTESVSGDAVAMATEILWAKSGRQFDVCTVTLRPCRDECFDVGWGDSWSEWGTTWPRPYLYQGQWFNLACGSCRGGCSCTQLSTFTLEQIASIEAIKINGVTLDPASYVVYDHRLVVRTDGLWPLCNDLTKADTETGTWSVTARIGVDPPVLGQRALGELALQLALACVGDLNCELPSTVQQVVRQGVTLTMFDPTLMYADGKLGLRFCDLFLSSFNSQNIAAAARVYDPDRRGPRVQT